VDGTSPTESALLGDWLKDFFSRLRSITDFRDCGREEYYEAAPADWYLVVTDVVGSTKAIQAGHYREVNSAGAATLVAIQQVLGKRSFPFAFGGDGSTALVPPDSIDSIRSALLGLKGFVSTGLGLELRVGLVSVGTLFDAGHTLLVGRYAPGLAPPQGLFVGSAVPAADAMLKDPDSGVELREGKVQALDLSSLSCRWDAVPAHRGLTLSILVEPREPGFTVYRDIIAAIDGSISGAFEEMNPIKLLHMRYRSLREILRSGRHFRSTADSNAARRKQGVLGHLIYGLGAYRLFPTWKHYREMLPSHSDFQKVDGVVRMVIDCSDEDATRLDKALTQLLDEGRVFFGLKRSSSAIMTCLMEAPEDGQHIHFVDGAEGGYAEAALQLKEQKARINDPDKKGSLD